MALVAAIVRQPRLTQEEWISIIDSGGLLRRPEPRIIVNPFTGTKQVEPQASGHAEIVVDGLAVGAIEASSEFDEDGELLVFAGDGKDEAVATAVAVIAERLNATVEWFGRG